MKITDKINQEFLIQSKKILFYFNNQYFSVKYFNTSFQSLSILNVFLHKHSTNYCLQLTKIIYFIAYKYIINTKGGNYENSNSF